MSRRGHKSCDTCTFARPTDQKPKTCMPKPFVGRGKRGPDFVASPSMFVRGSFGSRETC
jgi:hypothetical protein